jgi:two-component system OmpR family sensor kinase
MSSPATDAARPGAAPSLRRRLSWLLLAAIAVVSAIQAASAYRTALRNADALFDSQLQQFAQSVGAGMPLSPRDARLYEFSIQVWGPDGVTIYRSQGVELPSSGILGFSEAMIRGVRYRIYLLRAGDRTIQVAQDLDARRARARGLALQAVAPVVLLAPLLMLAVWLIIAWSLAPVERMRRQVAERPAEDLSPLPEPGVPREVLPLVRELNLLFQRVDAAFASQRRFVADAAHELRSPLTALKLQAQAVRGLPPGPEQSAALERLERGIERAIQLLTQLLALARAENDAAQQEAAWEPVDLQALCRAAVADVLPQAHAKEVDVGVHTPATEATVRGRFEALRGLLVNLLDNAVKFAPRGGQVDISVERSAAGVVLRVEDDGPGIAAEERARVFDRFYRGREGADAPGSGLGLAIVQAIAQRHGAQVRLDRSGRLGGLLAEVRFPPGLSEA